MDDVETRLQSVRRAIEDACERAGRAPAEVTLVAVGKAHSTAAIRALYEFGVRDFGESYVQEWQEKVDEMPDDIRWHFIGHLQSNKAKYLADRVVLVHSVDRKSVMKKLDRRSDEPVSVLLQVNTGDDPAKGGVAPEDVESLLEKALAYDGLRVCGLMTIPPLTDDPEEVRPFFRVLRERFDAARRWLARECPERLDDFEHLSMGMSADYPIAVEEGATMVRVGTALFGPRDDD